jgi:ParB/RepB/Spo0J family partition protein
LTQALTVLAVSHHDTLRYLADNPGAAPGKVARALGRDPSNARRDFPKLEAEGLIQDARLTARGQAALDVMDGSKAEPRPGAVIGLKHAEIRIAPLLNPRRTFEPEAVEDLALSIDAYGLLQNLVVRKVEGTNGVRHVLVAGEHRLAAIALLIKRGKWPDDRAIPCKVIEADDARHTEVALVENLRRRALEPMEEARAFQKLRDVYQVPTAEIARRIGLTQRLVQQRLQLLGLDDAQQQAVTDKRLNVQDARKLVATPKPAPERPTIEAAIAEAAAELVLDDELMQLLWDVGRAPRCGLTSYAQVGRWVETSWVSRRFDKLFTAGLIDQPRTPMLTPAGLMALEPPAPVQRAPARVPTGAPIIERMIEAEDEDEAAEVRLIQQVRGRLEAATKALDQGSLMSASRLAIHAEFWEPAPTVAFLELVLKALQPMSDV